METFKSIEGYFKARSSYLVCKHSSAEPLSLNEKRYLLNFSKFEVSLQKELNDLLDKYEDDSSVKPLQLLNRLLQISDKARWLFNEINSPYKMLSVHSAQNQN